MKNILNYFYNLYPNKIIKNTRESYFYFNNKKFYIKKINRPIEDLELIININLKLESINKTVYKILNNKENKYYFEYEKEYYIVLMVIKNENEILDIFDLFNFNNLIKTDKNTIINRNDYLNLWSEKIDYYEYMMSLINEDDLLINTSFSYFIGWAEVAVSYYSETISNVSSSNNFYLSHKRLSNITSKEIYNPLNFIFDYPLRSLSEFLKNNFINDEIDYIEFESFIKKNNFNEFDLRIFFARMIYPSFYFDLFLEYQESRDKTKLKDVILKASDYEKFLKNIFHIINKYVNIPNYLN